MKLLLVAGYFPPYSPYSATRAAKFVKYLLGRGHDVRVLAPKNTLYRRILQHGLPDELVHFTPILERGELSPRETPREQFPPMAVRAKASVLATVGLPDARAGWTPIARWAAARVFGDWRPDVIYATAPPYTSFLVAKAIAQAWHRPWVAELRDLWTDHPYYDTTGWRRWVDRRMERGVLPTAAGLVTVTAGWAQQAAERWGLPTLLCMNGYDPDDFDVPADPPGADGPLTIFHPGSVYAGKRDPAALFEALQRLGATAEDFKADFFGTMEVVDDLARANGIEQLVTMRRSIPHAEAIAKEKSSDLLLLLRWDDPREDNVIGGKLFEYIGARRPILCVGSSRGEAAEIIRDNGFGVTTNDPAAIAEHLTSWLAQKRRGGIPAPTSEPPLAFSRDVQFHKAEQFLADVIAGTARPGGG